MSEALAALTETNLDDLVAAFGWQTRVSLAKAVRRIFYRAAYKFSLQMLAFDEAVARGGLPAGARHALYYYVQDVKLFGGETLPEDGPVLFLSNHPGMTDTLCLFAAIARPDLRIIAFNRPFLRSLPNVSEHLFYISDDPGTRMGAVKKAAAHLRNGGALLTFPAGQIEPDPNVYPGAAESLEDWTSSAGVFLRFAPQTKVIPTLVRSVLWDKAVKHPLTRFKQDRMDRERLGAAFQLLAHVVFDLRPLTASVQFGPSLCLDSSASTNDLSAFHTALLGRMRFLIENPPTGMGVSAL